MALDREDIEFIEKQNQRMEERLSETISLQASGTRGFIESEIDRIHEMDEIRNGKIQRNEENIEVLKKETRIVRFFQRNPMVFFIMFLVFVVGIVVGISIINVRTSIEKILPIELKHEGYE